MITIQDELKNAIEGLFFNADRYYTKKCEFTDGYSGSFCFGLKRR